MTLIGILYLLNPINKSNVDIGKSEKIWKWVVVFFIVVDLFYMKYKPYTCPENRNHQ